MLPVAASAETASPSIRAILSLLVVWDRIMLRFFSIVESYGAMRCAFQYLIIPWDGTLLCGAVRCGAVRCGAVRCGAVRCDAVNPHGHQTAKLVELCMVKSFDNSNRHG